MKRRFLQQGGWRWPGIAAGVCLGAWLQVSAQTLGLGTVSNFTVPEYYGPPHQNQLKSLIKGAESEPLPDGRYRIHQLQAETYSTNGVREVVLRAPECLYDPVARAASAAGPIRAETDDGRLLVEGEGFLWRPSERMLIISNRVHSIYRLQPPGPKPTKS